MQFSSDIVSFSFWWSPFLGEV